MESIEKEQKLVDMGITTFVYKDDIDFYIDTVANTRNRSERPIKIIELERYEREIPDEIVNLIAEVKDKFDQLYVVFTDYTGKIERQVKKERREKDPILFGTFQNQADRTVIDRFYYLGDWEDEYCDLTLDKMVNETEKTGKRNIIKTISTPKDIEELKEQLNSLVEQDARFVIQNNQKKSLFSKIKTVITGK